MNYAELEKKLVSDAEELYEEYFRETDLDFVELGDFLNFVEYRIGGLGGEPIYYTNAAAIELICPALFDYDDPADYLELLGVQIDILKNPIMLSQYLVSSIVHNGEFGESLQSQFELYAEPITAGVPVDDVFA